MIRDPIGPTVIASLPYKDGLLELRANMAKYYDDCNHEYIFLDYGPSTDMYDIKGQPEVFVQDMDWYILEGVLDWLEADREPTDVDE